MRESLSVLCAALSGAAIALYSAGVASEPRPAVVAIDVTMAPFGIMRDGAPAGFDVDLIEAVARAGGFEVKLQPMPFDGIIPALQAGSIDAAAAAMTLKKKRFEVVDFSMPYYRYGLSILTREGSGISDQSDLKGRVIASKLGAAAADFVKRQGNYGASLKLFSSIDGAYMALASRLVDAVIFDDPVNKQFIAHYPKGFKIAGGMLRGEYYAIAISKKRPDLKEKIDRGLATIKKTGEYRVLFAKWFQNDQDGAVFDAIDPHAVAIDG